MSLCYLMISDFKHGTGRYDLDNPPDDQLLYSDYNLEFGIQYAEDLLERGYTIEPFHHFGLHAFIAWARRKLGEQRYH